MSKKHVILHHFYDQGIIQSGAVYLSLDFVVTYCQNYDGLPGQWAVGSYGKVLLPMACKSYRKTAPLCNGNSIR